jgi:oxygen-independent coproporphyrinogen-3 oxidase
LAKCAYCDFASIPLPAPEWLDRYVNALKIEIQQRAQGTVDSIYFGGGTPSLFRPHQLADILKTLTARVACAPDVEITLEVNPATSTPADLQAWQQLGINRLSLGVQSTQDRFLTMLGRLHTAEQARQWMAGARATGFANISCDLMYGLPGQTFAEFQADMQELLQWEPDHLSLYGLTLEPGTPLALTVERGELPLPDDDLVADMYEFCQSRLKTCGFFQYELSNFAKNSKKCRHNCIYWEYQPYLGLGSAAHSFLQGRRSWNQEDPLNYCQNLETGKLPIKDFEKITGKKKAAERLILGLRLTQGVSVNMVKRLFGATWSQLYHEAIQPSLDEGLLEEIQNRLRLTDRGMLLSNQVFRRMV